MYSVMASQTFQAITGVLMHRMKMETIIKLTIRPSLFRFNPSQNRPVSTIKQPFFVHNLVNMVIENHVVQTAS